MAKKRGRKVRAKVRRKPLRKNSAVKRVLIVKGEK